MRRILVENARRKNRQKRGGDLERVELDERHGWVAPPNDDILAVDEALEALERVDAQAAGLVKLRFFAGLTTAEAAAALGMSVRSAHDLWAYARSWLKRELRPD